MKLAFRRIDTLPRLAWCARLIKAQDTVEVCHGPWVETADDFFCEGAWSGDFLSREVDTCILMGSGGRIAGNTLVIAAPNHPLERLFLLKHGKTLLVSNSFAFVLACAHDHVHPRALLYDVKLAAFTEGPQGYARSLPTRRGHKVRLYYHCNLLIDSNLHVREAPKRAVRAFVNFADYKAFLLDQVTALQANASDPHRQITYRPMATISAGYDSPAAAVFARAVGCTEALTFSQARGGTSEDTADSGAEIAARLGMQVHEFNRLDYLQEKGFPEAEFFGWGAQESPWAGHLEGRLLFTGIHGDKVWDRNCKTVSPHIIRGDPHGHNLNAFRLRVGWIHLPVPFLGCTSHPSIHSISTSKEMEPWSLRNRYDRPIPRRLVEEAGVERQQFGSKKRGVSIDLHNEGLRERMTQESFDDYMKYYHQHWNAWMTIKQWVCLRLRALYRRHEAYNGRLSRFLKDRAGMHVNLPILIPRGIRIGRYGRLDILSLLIPWSIEKILPSYAVDPCAKPQGDESIKNLGVRPPLPPPPPAGRDTSAGTPRPAHGRAS
jgi:hypothetical protein